VVAVVGAISIAFTGEFGDGSLPPQATRTADVPSAARVDARCSRDRFGRMQELLVGSR
jgi:hypothetical protein